MTKWEEEAAYKRKERSRQNFGHNKLRIYMISDKSSLESESTRREEICSDISSSESQQIYNVPRSPTLGSETTSGSGASTRGQRQGRAG